MIVLRHNRGINYLPDEKLYSNRVAKFLSGTIQKTCTTQTSRFKNLPLTEKIKTKSPGMKVATGLLVLPNPIPGAMPASGAYIVANEGSKKVVQSLPKRGRGGNRVTQGIRDIQARRIKESRKREQKVLENYYRKNKPN